MKIDSNSWNVLNTENLYKDFKQKFDTNTDTNHNNIKQDQFALQTTHSTAEVVPSVLSNTEVDVLNMLFGSNQNETMNFYGNQKPKNIQSGYFLDVKG